MNENDKELDKYISDMADIPEEGAVVDENVLDAGEQDGTGADLSKTNQAPTDQSPQDQNAKTGKEVTGKTDVQKDQQLDQSGKDAKQDKVRPLGDGSFIDNQGNIVDKDGGLIAKGGFAARIYQKNQRMQSRLSEQDDIISEMRKVVGERSVISEAARNYNLSTDELAQAVDMAGRMKRGDALGVAKEVIALLTAQGYNVTDLLGADVGDSIDMRGIKAMIDQRLGPVEQQRQVQQADEEARRNGLLAYNEFVRNNEYADLHADVIANVMKRERKTPQQAYNSLRTFALNNGLDFSLPLGQQIQERQTQRSGQQQQQKGSRQKPLPNGANDLNAGDSSANLNIPMADADEDWGSIIRKAQQLAN